MNHPNQSTEIKEAINSFLDKGIKDKQDIYSKVVDELGVPRPTVWANYMQKHCYWPYIWKNTVMGHLYVKILLWAICIWKNTVMGHIYGKTLLFICKNTVMCQLYAKTLLWAIYK